MLYEVILSNPLFPMSDLNIYFFLSAAPDLFKKTIPRFFKGQKSEYNCLQRKLIIKSHWEYMKCHQDTMLSLPFQAGSNSVFYLTENWWEGDLQQGILSGEVDRLSLFAYYMLRMLSFLQQTQTQGMLVMLFTSGFLQGRQRHGMPAALISFSLGPDLTWPFYPSLCYLLHWINLKF